MSFDEKLRIIETTVSPQTKTEVSLYAIIKIDRKTFSVGVLPQTLGKKTSKNETHLQFNPAVVAWSTLVNHFRFWFIIEKFDTLDFIYKKINHFLYQL